MADHMTFFRFSLFKTIQTWGLSLCSWDTREAEEETLALDAGPAPRAGSLQPGGGVGRVRPLDAREAFLSPPFPCARQNLCSHGSGGGVAGCPTWERVPTYGEAWARPGWCHTASSRSSGPRCRSCVRPGKEPHPEESPTNLGGWGCGMCTPPTQGLTRPGGPSTPESKGAGSLLQNGVSPPIHVET